MPGENNFKSLHTPLSQADIRSLKAGDQVRITGLLYTARDAAHRRLCLALRDSRPLPFDLEGAVIYFVGPTPARPGRVIGSAGPTTSSRMDAFSPLLIASGLRAMIGKGCRAEPVRQALVQYGAVHLSALGGAGALLSRHIIRSRLIAYEDLGTEAVRELQVVDFPTIVAYDAHGNTIYAHGGT
jgi:fumarate hydratase subunit beta